MKAFKFVVAAIVVLAAASCKKIDRPEPVIVDDFFEKEIASYVWEYSDSYLVIDLANARINIDKKEGGRSLIMQYDIDSFAGVGESGYEFITHSPLQSVSHVIHLYFRLDGDRLRYQRDVYTADEGEDPFDTVANNYSKAMPLNIYSYVMAETSEYYVGFNKEKYFFTWASPLYSTAEELEGLSSAVGTHEFVCAGLGLSEDYQGVDVSGKYACVDRGSITFSEKCKYAIENGATGLIVVNNVKGGLSPAHDDYPKFPVFGVTQEFGAKLKAAGNGTIKVGVEKR